MRILIATGGSAHSDIAVCFGAQFAVRTGCAPTILTIIKHEAQQPKADAILTRAVSLMALDVANVTTAVRVGNPAKEIIREAGDGNYDLVIVGSRPTHKLLTHLLGSTAEWVVSHAPCPVIIARGKVGPIQRILICTTGASSLSRYTSCVARLVSLLDEQSEVTVLHVMSQISAGPGARNEWQLSAGAAELIHNHAPEGELIKQEIQLLEQSPARISPKIRHGLVVEEISAEAESGDYDLIIIGANQNRGWQRFLLDNLAHQIVVQTDRPVLVV
jgi:nucleotide-binding universal stress UspA family protein